MIKAVIVGINAYKTNALQGCVNDANDVIDYLIANDLATADQIAPLYDERATKQAIVSALQDMIRTSSAGDHVYFHFSGHGTRIASPSQSDGYEEALVPVDFDWSDMSTFLTDSEFVALANTVPAGVAWTVVTDACHSGGLSKDAGRRIRFLPPPPDVAFMLRARPRQVVTRDLTATNTLLVAACKATEEAADTSFNGKPNGAFTYYWLKELGDHADSTVDDLVSRETADLSSFNMHPLEDGPTALRSARFLQTPAPTTRKLTPPIITRGEEVFDQSWRTQILGMAFGVELAILIANGGFDFQLSADAGVPLRWTFHVDGNTSQRIDLGYGFAIVLSVSNWTATTSNIGFDLGIAIAPPFLGPVTITQQHVTLPASALPRALAAPTTAAELLALIELSQLGYTNGPAPAAGATGSRDAYSGGAYVWNFAGGLFGCSYNHNTDDQGATIYVPAGSIRDHVEVVLDPPGSGNVHFNRWLDSDPHTGGFEFHVGCASCGGGRATFVLHTVPDPAYPRAVPSAAAAAKAPPRVAVQAAPAAKEMNGHSKLGEKDILDMPNPTGGGSVRV